MSIKNSEYEPDPILKKIRLDLIKDIIIDYPQNVTGTEQFNTQSKEIYLYPFI